MYDAVVVEVCDSRKRGPNEVASIGLVVVAFATNTVEEFASQREVGNEVYCS